MFVFAGGGGNGLNTDWDVNWNITDVKSRINSCSSSFMRSIRVLSLFKSHSASVAGKFGPISC